MQSMSKGPAGCSLFWSRIVAKESPRSASHSSRLLWQIVVKGGVQWRSWAAESRSTCCSFAREIRRVRSWPKPSLNRLGRGKFKAFSAGSQPAGYVHPLALQMLRNAHFDVTGFRSKPWDEFAAPDAPKLDFVFTVCDNAAKEVCPIWPGQPMTAHWGLPDPAKAEGSDAEKATAFADTMRMLNQRIGIFVSLPLDKLSKLALQKQLDEIGKTKAETETA